MDRITKGLATLGCILALELPAVAQSMSDRIAIDVLHGIAKAVIRDAVGGRDVRFPEPSHRGPIPMPDRTRELPPPPPGPRDHAPESSRGESDVRRIESAPHSTDASARAAMMRQASELERDGFRIHSSQVFSQGGRRNRGTSYYFVIEYSAGRQGRGGRDGGRDGGRQDGRGGDWDGGQDNRGPGNGPGDGRRDDGRGGRDGGQGDRGPGNGPGDDRRDDGRGGRDGGHDDWGPDNDRRGGGRGPAAFQSHQVGYFNTTSEASTAMEESKQGMQAAGFEVIGGSVRRQDSSPWNYYFKIEYVSRGSRNEPTGISEHRSAYYPTQSGARTSLGDYKSGMRDAGYDVVGGSVFRQDSSPWNYYFIVQYAVRSDRRQPDSIQKYTDGNFPYESHAQSALTERLAGLKRAGFQVIGGSVFREESSPWNYYFVIEYVDEGRGRPR